MNLHVRKEKERDSREQVNKEESESEVNGRPERNPRSRASVARHDGRANDHIDVFETINYGCDVAQDG